MPTLFQSIKGFAGASGVGILCLFGLYFIFSVFATNLGAVVNDLATDPIWSAIAALPVLFVAYVLGVLAISLVDRASSPDFSSLSALSDIATGSRYEQLKQEAEILSGSVVAFTLIGVASALNGVMVYTGWFSTLMFTAGFCGAIAFGAWKISRKKQAAASALITAAMQDGA